MSNIIRSAHIILPLTPNTNSLKAKQKAQAILYSFIQTLGEHEWDKGIADIQKALGIYLMQNNIESKERKQTNQETASQLQFIVFSRLSCNSWGIKFSQFPSCIYLC